MLVLMLRVTAVKIALIAPTLASGALVAPLQQAQFKSRRADRAYWLIAAPAAREHPQVRTFMKWLTTKAAPLARSAGESQ